MLERLLLRLLVEVTEPSKRTQIRVGHLRPACRIAEVMLQSLQLSLHQRRIRLLRSLKTLEGRSLPQQETLLELQGLLLLLLEQGRRHRGLLRLRRL